MSQNRPKQSLLNPARVSRQSSGTNNSNNNNNNNFSAFSSSSSRPSRVPSKGPVAAKGPRKSMLPSLRVPVAHPEDYEEPVVTSPALTPRASGPSPSLSPSLSPSRLSVHDPLQPVGDIQRIEGELWFITPKTGPGKKVGGRMGSPQWVVCEDQRVSIYSGWGSTSRLLEEMPFDRVRLLFNFSHIHKHKEEAISGGPSTRRISVKKGVPPPKNHFRPRIQEKSLNCYYYFGVEGVQREVETGRYRRQLIVLCTDKADDYKIWINFWTEMAELRPMIGNREMSISMSPSQFKDSEGGQGLGEWDPDYTFPREVPVDSLHSSDEDSVMAATRAYPHGNSPLLDATGAPVARNLMQEMTTSEKAEYLEEYEDVAREGLECAEMSTRGLLGATMDLQSVLVSAKGTTAPLEYHPTMESLAGDDVRTIASLQEEIHRLCKELASVTSSPVVDPTTANQEEDLEAMRRELVQLREENAMLRDTVATQRSSFQTDIEKAFSEWKNYPFSKEEDGGLVKNEVLSADRDLIEQLLTSVAHHHNSNPSLAVEAEEVASESPLPSLIKECISTFDNEHQLRLAGLESAPLSSIGDSFLTEALKVQYDTFQRYVQKDATPPPVVEYMNCIHQLSQHNANQTSSSISTPSRTDLLEKTETTTRDVAVYLMQHTMRESIYGEYITKLSQLTDCRVFVNPDHVQDITCHPSPFRLDCSNNTDLEDEHFDETVLENRFALYERIQAAIEYSNSLRENCLFFQSLLFKTLGDTDAVTSTSTFPSGSVVAECLKAWRESASGGRDSRDSSSWQLPSTLQDQLSQLEAEEHRLMSHDISLELVERHVGHCSVAEVNESIWQLLLCSANKDLILESPIHTLSNLAELLKTEVTAERNRGDFCFYLLCNLYDEASGEQIGFDNQTSLKKLREPSTDPRYQQTIVDDVSLWLQAAPEQMYQFVSDALLVLNPLSHDIENLRQANAALQKEIDSAQAALDGEAAKDDDDDEVGEGEERKPKPDAERRPLADQVVELKEQHAAELADEQARLQDALAKIDAERGDAAVVPNDEIARRAGALATEGGAGVPLSADEVAEHVRRLREERDAAEQSEAALRDAIYGAIGDEAAAPYKERDADVSRTRGERCDAAVEAEDCVKRGDADAAGAAASKHADAERAHEEAKKARDEDIALLREELEKTRQESAEASDELERLREERDAALERARALSEAVEETVGRGEAGEDGERERGTLSDVDEVRERLRDVVDHDERLNYHDESKPMTTTDHKKVFEGDDWDLVLEKQPEALRAAFATDASHACHVRVEDITNLDFALGSLHATFGVSHNDDVDPAELDRRLEEHAFPNVMALYARRHGEKTGLDLANEELEKARQESTEASDELERLREEVRAAQAALDGEAAKDDDDDEVGEGEERKPKPDAERRPLADQVVELKEQHAAELADEQARLQDALAKIDAERGDAAVVPNDEIARRAGALATEGGAGVPLSADEVAEHVRRLREERDAAEQSEAALRDAIYGAIGDEAAAPYKERDADVSRTRGERCDAAVEAEDCVKRGDADAAGAAASKHADAERAHEEAKKARDEDIALLREELEKTRQESAEASDELERLREERDAALERARALSEAVEETVGRGEAGEDGERERGTLSDVDEVRERLRDVVDHDERLNYHDESKPMTTTDHKKVFEGDDWDLVLEKQPEALRAAFATDASHACHVRVEDITNLDFALGSLHATFGVSHNDDVDPAELDRRLEEHAFPNVMALYARRHGEKTGLDLANEELEKARQESTEASDELERLREEVRAAQAALDGEAAKDDDDDEVGEGEERKPKPDAERRPLADQVVELKEQHAAELADEQARLQDALAKIDAERGDAAVVPNDEIARRAGALATEGGAGVPLSADEVAEHVRRLREERDAAEQSEAALRDAIYGAIGDEAAAPYKERDADVSRTRGERCDAAVEAEDCVKRGDADAAGAAASKHADAERAHEEAKKARDEDIALLREELEKTRQESAEASDELERLREERDAALERARALSEAVEETVGRGEAGEDGERERGTLSDVDEVRERLRDVVDHDERLNYHDESKPMTTTDHKKVFEGDDWDLVLEKQPEALRAAFATDASHACHVRVEDITNLDFALGSLHATFGVSHNDDVDPAELDRRLEEHAFPNVMALYARRHGEKTGLDLANEELEKARQESTEASDELERLREEVRAAQAALDGEAAKDDDDDEVGEGEERKPKPDAERRPLADQVVELKEQHAAELADEQARLQDALAKIDAERGDAAVVPNDEIARRAGALATEGGAGVPLSADEVAEHVRRLREERDAAEQSEAALRDAIYGAIGDEAAAPYKERDADVSRTRGERCDAAVEAEDCVKRGDADAAGAAASKHADAERAHEEAKKARDEDIALLREELEKTRQESAEASDELERLREERDAALERARALSEAVEETVGRGEAGEDGERERGTLSDVDEVRERLRDVVDHDERLNYHDESKPMTTTDHKKVFEGDDWDLVLEKQPEALRAAFATDASHACHVRVEDITNLDFALGSLHATFGVSHNDDVDPAELDRRLEEHAFPNVMALYARRHGEKTGLDLANEELEKARQESTEASDELERLREEVRAAQAALDGEAAKDDDDDEVGEGEERKPKPDAERRPLADQVVELKEQHAAELADEQARLQDALAKIDAERGDAAVVPNDEIARRAGALATEGGAGVPLSADEVAEHVRRLREERDAAEQSEAALRDAIYGAIGDEAAAPYKERDADVSRTRGERCDAAVEAEDCVKRGDADAAGAAASKHADAERAHEEAKKARDEDIALLREELEKTRQESAEASDELERLREERDAALERARALSEAVEETVGRGEAGEDGERERGTLSDVDEVRERLRDVVDHDERLNYHDESKPMTTTDHKKVFEGDDWDLVLEKQPEALRAAFATDASHACHVRVEDITNLDFALGSLHATFGVSHNDDVDPAELDRRLEEHAFPNVMALYARRHGEKTGLDLANEELEKARQESTEASDELERLREEVRAAQAALDGEAAKDDDDDEVGEGEERKPKPDAERRPLADQVVELKEQHAAELADEQARLQDALAKIDAERGDAAVVPNDEIARRAGALATEGGAGVPLSADEVAEHVRRLREERDAAEQSEAALRDAIYGAIGDEAAAPYKERDADVSRTRGERCDAAVEAEDCVKRGDADAAGAAASKHADAERAHEEAKKARDEDIALLREELEKTRQESAEASDELERLREERDAALERARALSEAVEETVGRGEAGEDGERERGTLSDVDEVRERLRDVVDHDERLNYHDESKPMTTTDHKKVFEGDDWDLVLEKQPEALRAAFATDASHACHVRVEDITNLDFALGSLHATFGVSHNDDVDPAELDRRLEEHAFPNVMALYARRHGEKTGLDLANEELEKARQESTEASDELERLREEVRAAQAALDGEAAKDDDDDEVGEGEERKPKPDAERRPLADQVVELKEQHAAELADEQARLQDALAKIDAERGDAAVVPNDEIARRAGALATEGGAGVPLSADEVAEHVRRLREERDAAEQSEAALRDAIYGAIGDEAAAPYKERDADVSRTRGERCDAAVEAEDCVKRGDADAAGAAASKHADAERAHEEAKKARDEDIALLREELEKTRQESAEASDELERLREERDAALERARALSEAVEETVGRGEAGEDGERERGTLSDVDEVRERLRDVVDHDERLNYHDESKPMTTTDHKKVFEGDDWDLVLEKQPEALRAAFATDASHACHVRVEDITNLDFALGSLHATFGVSHNDDVDPAELDRRLEEHAFPNVMALYARRHGEKTGLDLANEELEKARQESTEASDELERLREEVRAAQAALDGEAAKDDDDDEVGEGEERKPKPDAERRPLADQVVELKEQHAAELADEQARLQDALAKIDAERGDAAVVPNDEIARRAGALATEGGAGVPLSADEVAEHVRRLREERDAAEQSEAALRDAIYGAIGDEAAAPYKERDADVSRTRGERCDAAVEAEDCVKRGDADAAGAAASKHADAERAHEEAKKARDEDIALLREELEKTRQESAEASDELERLREERDAALERARALSEAVEETVGRGEAGEDGERERGTLSDVDEVRERLRDVVDHDERLNYHDESKPMTTTDHKKVFEGDDWDLVLEKQPEALRAAFATDASHACHVRVEDITNLDFALGSLHATFGVSHNDDVDPAELDRRLEEHAFPNVMALYARRHGEKTGLDLANEELEKARQESTEASDELERLREEVRAAQAALDGEAAKDDDDDEVGEGEERKPKPDAERRPLADQVVELKEQHAAELADEQARLQDALAKIDAERGDAAVVPNDEIARRAGALATEGGAGVPLSADEVAEHVRRLREERDAAEQSEAALRDAIYGAIGDEAAAPYKERDADVSRTRGERCDAAVEAEDCVKRGDADAAGAAASKHADAERAHEEAKKARDEDIALLREELEKTRQESAEASDELERLREERDAALERARALSEAVEETVGRGEAGEDGERERGTLSDVDEVRERLRDVVDHDERLNYHDESKPMTTTDHKKVFEGDDWDLVLEKQPEALRAAFATDASHACHVRVEDITNLDFALGSLHATFGVSHNDDVDPAELDRRLEEHAFPNVMALYARRHGEKTGLDLANEELEKARQESTEASDELERLREEVRAAQAALDGEAAKDDDDDEVGEGEERKPKPDAERRPLADQVVELKEQHAAELADEQARLQDALAKIDAERGDAAVVPNDEIARRAGALATEGGAGVPLSADEVAEHVRRLREERDAAEQSEAALRDAIYGAIGDEAAAPYKERDADVSRTRGERCDAAVEAEDCVKRGDADAAGAAASKHADAERAHEEAKKARDEDIALLREELEKTRQESAEASDELERLREERDAALERARALSEAVEETVGRGEAGEDGERERGTLSDVDEVRERLRDVVDHDERLNYHDESKPMTTTDHKKVFEGDDWDLVLEKQPEALRAAFATDASHACHVRVEDITNLDFALGSLHATFGVSHNDDVDPAELDRRLEEHAFPNVMALYARRHGEKTGLDLANEELEKARQELEALLGKEAEVNQVLKGCVRRMRGGQCPEVANDDSLMSDVEEEFEAVMECVETMRGAIMETYEVLGGVVAEGESPEVKDLCGNLTELARNTSSELANVHLLLGLDETAENHRAGMSDMIAGIREKLEGVKRREAEADGVLRALTEGGAIRRRHLKSKVKPLPPIEASSQASVSLLPLSSNGASPVGSMVSLARGSIVTPVLKDTSPEGVQEFMDDIRGKLQDLHVASNAIHASVELMAPDKPAPSELKPMVSYLIALSNNAHEAMRLTENLFEGFEEEKAKEESSGKPYILNLATRTAALVEALEQLKMEKDAAEEENDNLHRQIGFLLNQEKELLTELDRAAEKENEMNAVNMALLKAEEQVALKDQEMQFLTDLLAEEKYAFEKCVESCYMNFSDMLEGCRMSEEAVLADFEADAYHSLSLLAGIEEQVAWLTPVVMGMSDFTAITPSEATPASIDTPQNLERLRRLLEEALKEWMRQKDTLEGRVKELERQLDQEVRFREEETARQKGLEEALHAQVEAATRALKEERLSREEESLHQRELEEALRDMAKEIESSLERERAERGAERKLQLEEEAALRRENHALENALQEAQEEVEREKKQSEEKRLEKEETHQREVDKLQRSLVDAKAVQQEMADAHQRRVEALSQSHEQELEDLKKANRGLRATKTEAEDKVEELERKLKELGAEVHDATEARRRLQEALGEAVERADAAEDQLGDIKTRLEAQKERLEKMKEEMKSAQQTARENEKAQQETLSNLERENIANKLAKESAERDRDQLRAEVPKWRGRLEDLQRQKQAVMERLNRVGSTPPSSDTDAMVTGVDQLASELEELRREKRSLERRQETAQSVSTNTEDNTKELLEAMHQLIEGSTDIGNTALTPPGEVVERVLEALRRGREQSESLRLSLLDQFPEGREDPTVATLTTPQLLTALLEEKERQAQLVQSTLTAECQRLADKASRLDQHARVQEAQHAQEMTEVELRVGQMRELVRRKLEADAIAEKHIEEIELAMEDHLTRIYENAVEKVGIATHIEQLRRLLREKTKAAKKRRDYPYNE